MGAADQNRGVPGEWRQALNTIWKPESPLVQLWVYLPTRGHGPVSWSISWPILAVCSSLVEDSTAFPDIHWVIPDRWRLKVKVKSCWTFTAQKLQGIYKCFNKPFHFLPQGIGSTSLQRIAKKQGQGSNLPPPPMLPWQPVFDKQDLRTAPGKNKTQNYLFYPTCPPFESLDPSWDGKVFLSIKGAEDHPL